MMFDACTPPQCPRRRSAPATRQAILDAARHCFSSEGYDQVGVREIAARAGVDPALINRYFGSKEGLFSEVIGGKFDLRHIVGDDLSTLGETMLRAICTKKGAEGHDPLRALLQSYGSDVAREKLRSAIVQGFVEPLAARLSGSNPVERAELVGSALLGIVLYRAIAGPLSDEERERMVTAMAPYVQGIIDGEPIATFTKG
ncbi:MAG: TetR family transcriptional regulator [Thermomicrobiales bacterium]|nr:TetR family transcriptional regulator [Thermomicrobiales bacterium]